jgi:hypothetical protein
MVTRRITFEILGVMQGRKDDHRVGIEFLPVRIIGDTFSRIFQRNQSGNLDALGVENRAA